MNKPAQIIKSTILCEYRVSCIAYTCYMKSLSQKSLKQPKVTNLNSIKHTQIVSRFWHVCYYYFFLNLLIVFDQSVHDIEIIIMTILLQSQRLKDLQSKDNEKNIVEVFLFFLNITYWSFRASLTNYSGEGHNSKLVN